MVLLLIMTVALAIGLSVVQRSVTDVSTSTKTEESARAFSAAEAGIERAINRNSVGTLNVTSNELNNSSSAQVTGYPVPDGNIKNFEIPSVRQEDPANIWLVSSADLSSSRYSGSTLDVYWGDYSVTPRSAIEISVISGPSGGPYTVTKSFYDGESSRALLNHFSAPTSCPSGNSVITHLTPSPGKQYGCKVTVTIPANPIALRARLIYTNGKDQPIAFVPVGASLFPQQGSLFISTGAAGDTKRTVILQKQDNVLPFFFDFVLFSLSNITK